MRTGEWGGGIRLYNSTLAQFVDYRSKIKEEYEVDGEGFSDCFLLKADNPGGLPRG